ncbi:MAG: pyruvate kinase [Phycisphaerae bacterium]|nr:pyruvate kinase [Phycisphaerae bacterium]
MSAPLNPRDCLHRLYALRRECLHFERSRHDTEAKSAATDGATSAEADVSRRNLLHYLAIRRHDLRELHAPLAESGLSSLGRIEPHVLENLSGVIGHLERLCDVDPGETAPESPISLRDAHDLIERRTTALLGPSRITPDAKSEPGDRLTGDAEREPDGVRIMVTLPSEAAEDSGLVRSLVDAGMCCARINTAHDSPEAWIRMCENVRAESARLKRLGRGECRILMDLAGPKLRTGPIEPGPEVIRIKPLRDPLGRVVRDASVVLRPIDAVEPRPSEVPIERAWLESLEPGDAIEMFDTRGRRRVLHVERLAIGSGDLRVIATSDRTIYFQSNTMLRLLRPRTRERETVVGRLPATAQAIVVRPGDHLRLSLSEQIGRPSSVLEPVATITTTLPEAFALARVGEAVWIDDGRIGAVIEAIANEAIDLRVLHAAPNGDRILEDKGINLPDTDIPVHGLTSQDLEVLPIAARYADMVGMSFVREAQDVIELRRRLDACDGTAVGTVLKIETRRAFDNLPSLLLAALSGPSVGVMIARGDLAVEVGYDRLAEVQEEILWLCEAAHLPVIWATQVLETMAKTGRPSRAEVTDAAMAERAECVMLNKGPYIVEAVRFLDNLLSRMQEHQSKKRTILRALNVARRFGAASTVA